MHFPGDVTTKGEISYTDSVRGRDAGVRHRELEKFPGTPCRYRAVPSRLQNSHIGSEVSDMSLGTLTINGVTHSMVPSYPNRYGRLP